MATNPRVPQGTLNRIRGSIVLPDLPELNVTAPFLGRGGISFGLQGESTVMIPTMTGAVTSPEPYMMAAVTINLLKTQALAAAWRTRMELDARIGDLTIWPDATTFPRYTVSNCAIVSVREMSFAGDDAGYVLVVHGYYDVNSSMWNLV